MALAARFLVVGTGVGGLTTALTLARKGIRCDVVEALKTRAPAARGLLLPPSAMSVFDQLGVADKIRAAGSPIAKWSLTNERGSGYASMSPTAGSVVGISADSLFAVLETELKTSGVHVRTATPLTALTQQQDGVRVVFGGGKPTSVYEGVVGADGAASRVRSLAFDLDAVGFKRLFSTWGLFSTAVARPPSFDARTMVEMWGEAGRLFLQPMSATHLHVWGTSTSNHPPERLKSGPRDTFEFVNVFKSQFRGQASAVLDAIHAANAPCLLEFPTQVRMKNWATGRVVLIGDAAHCMLPNLLHGAGLAAEDGFLLGRRLAATSPGSYVQPTLEAFVRERYPRVYTQQQRAWDMTVDAQPASRPRLAWRSVKLSVGGWLGLLRRRERAMTEPVKA